MDRFCGAVSTVMVVSLKYGAPFDTIIEKVKYGQSSVSLLILHYDIPPQGCNWSYQKSTESFLSRLSEDQQQWIHSNLQSFLVVDIPPLVLSRLGDGCPRVYMEQSVIAFRSLIRAIPSDNLIPTRRFLSQLSFIIHNLKNSLPTTQPEIMKEVTKSLQIPSGQVRSIFRSLWNVLCPDPSLSLSHPVFGDDYYLRVQERCDLCELVVILYIASRLRYCWFEALPIVEVGFCSCVNYSGGSA